MQLLSTKCIPSLFSPENCVNVCLCFCVFQPVGEALLYTLAAGLGEAIWTTEVKTAWIALYGAVESSMIAGMDSLKGKHVPGVTLLDTEIGY